MDENDKAISRRELLRWSAAGVAATALGLGWQNAAHGQSQSATGPASRPSERLAGKRPNIILILTDDQGYGDLGRHGNTIIQTPRLDRLHDESIRFTSCCVSPTCSPTRCAILTGRHEFKSGVSHTAYGRERMSPKATTLAQILKSAGYGTAVFGKWHLGDEQEYQPNRRGFDESLIHGGGRIGDNFGGSKDVAGNKLFDPILRHNGKFVQAKGYCTDIFFGQAMKWIASVRNKHPFFLYLPTNAAHAPVACPAEYSRIYDGKVSDKSVATFFGMITNIDENVGRLLDFLKKEDIEKDTLVIFMNDNGGTYGTDTFNAGMKGSKLSADYGGIRAMSFWRWPGRLAAGTREQLVAHIDILPTLAELAGAKTAPELVAQLDGFSLAPLLADARATWHNDRIVFSHVGRWAQKPSKYGRADHQASMRWRDYLQVCTKDGQWELFDIRADVGQTTDVAAKNPQIVASLSKAYDSWWADVLPVLEAENVNVKNGGYRSCDDLYREQVGDGKVHSL
jgi:arylsulfatase